MKKATRAFLLLLFGLTIAQPRSCADEIPFARSSRLVSPVVGSTSYTPKAGIHAIYATQVPKGFSDDGDFASRVVEGRYSSPQVVFNASYPNTFAYFSPDNLRVYFPGLVDPSSRVFDPTLYPALLPDDDFVTPSHHRSLGEPTSPEDDDDPVYARSRRARWGDANTNDPAGVTTAIPEPASLVLLGSGLLALAGLGRRRRSG